MQEEMAAHLELQAEANRACGMDAEEARYAALRQFGGVAQVQERCREQRGWAWLDGLWRDVRRGVRALWRERGFSVVSILVLALGLTGTAVIFAVFNGVFLKPWPFREPERLVDLNTTAPQWGQRFIGVAWPDFAAWRGDNTTFAEMAAFQTGSATLATGTQTERVNLSRVTANLPAVLGLEPVLGRVFAPDEDGPAAPPVALLGYRAWRNLFGGDPGVLGRLVQVNREAFTIIGVLPPGAAFPNDAALWVPLQNRSSAWCLLAVGRLKAGVAVAAARADLERVHAGLVVAGRANAATAPTVMGLKDRYVGSSARGGWALLLAGVLVLLIACGNVAALQVARGLARRSEIAMHLALGATPARVARRIVVECLLLCAAGAGGGVLLARWLFGGALVWLPARLPAWVDLSMDRSFVLGFGGFVVLAVVLSALVPAIDAARRRNLHDLLATGPMAGRGGSRFVGLRLLVVGEVALAIALLIVAGLLAEALWRVRAVDPGFSETQVLTYTIKLTGPAYDAGAARLAFFDEQVEGVRALPGVVAVGATTSLPLGGNHVGGFFVPADAVAAGPTGAPDTTVQIRQVMPGYFSTLGIRVTAGRTFDERDGTGAPVVMIDEALARRFWPGADPLGERLRAKGSEGRPLEVVGVVATVHQDGLDEPAAPGLYLPYRDDPPTAMTLVVRHAGDPAVLLPAIRELVRSRDAGLVVADVATMAERMADSLWLRRFLSGTLGVFATVALVLVGVGLYGVIGFVVRLQTRELGIRLALGAPRRSVLVLVLREALCLAGAGAALGIFGGVAGGGMLGSFLYGVSPLSPAAIGGGTMALVLVVLLACVPPGLRVLRLDPSAILRAE